LLNKGSWTGTAVITGLPFASAFGEHCPLTMSGFPNTTTYGTGAGAQPLITCYVPANGASLIIFKAGAGQDPGCPYSIVRTGYYFQVSGTYQTAT